VLEVVAARGDDGYRKRVIDRIAGWNGAREAADRRRAAAAANKGAPGAISAPYLFATLNRALSQDDIVIDEAIRNAPLVQSFAARQRQKAAHAPTPRLSTCIPSRAPFSAG
jgi:acetolactate synthase I/II/III large subunit